MARLRRPSPKSPEYIEDSEDEVHPVSKNKPSSISIRSSLESIDLPQDPLDPIAAVNIEQYNKELEEERRSLAARNGDQEDDSEEESGLDEDEDEDRDREEELSSDSNSGKDKEDSDEAGSPAEEAMSDGRKRQRKAGISGSLKTVKRGRKSTQTPDYSKIELPISLQFYYTCPTEKKILKNRIPARTEIWTFDFTQHHSTFEAQLLERSRIFYHPKQILVSDYDISYSIPRIAPNPISIDGINSYPPLVESARRNVNKAGQLVIYVVSKFSDQTEKENVENVKNTQSKGKKSKTPKACDIEEANRPHNDNISALQARWECQRSSCKSTYCWIIPEDSSHMHLTFTHFNIWAAAILDGPETATIEKPPNDRRFTVTNDANLGQPTILQSRQARREAAAAPSSLSLNISPDVIALFRPPAPGPAPLSSLLLSHDRAPGPHMSITDFVIQARIAPDIATKLSVQGYTDTNALQFAQIEDLKEIGLLPGYIAQLRFAVANWSVSRT
ncbi:hypothetical protein C8J55DRAFT_493572 [Lentinula edodes]|uniref:SAM domain-containing protein n=1 Tax=Lentinula lateritia TaxID=40482 RepID=A0A9W8ZS82_9AGAR|nr:hypothetical protein C8J55DRAFT_493572 [Lentinula edodes]